MRTALPKSLVSFLAILTLAALPAAASHYRYANIEWCAAPEYPDPYPIYFDFSIEVGYRYDGEAVGDSVFEFFQYGDGTGESIELTITEVHPAEGWFLAVGSARHLYGGGDLLSAGLDRCCRLNGIDGGANLNNLSNGPFIVQSLVYTAGELQCSPEIDMAPITWLSGGLGDTFTIPVPASHDQEDEKLGWLRPEHRPGRGPVVRQAAGLVPAGDSARGALRDRVERRPGAAHARDRGERPEVQDDRSAAG